MTCWRISLLAFFHDNDSKPVFMVAELGFNKPAKIRRRVDFPEPFLPVSKIHSPPFNSISALSRITPECFLRENSPKPFLE